MALLNSVQIFLLILFYFISVHLVTSITDEKYECGPRMQNFSSNGDSLACIKDVFCTSINCTGKFMESYFFQGEIKVVPCIDPPKMIITLDIPIVGLKNHKFKFTDGTKFPIPGASVPGINNMQLYLKFDMKKNESSGNIKIEMSILAEAKFIIKKWSIIRGKFFSTELKAVKCIDGHAVMPTYPSNHLTTVTNEIITTEAEDTNDKVQNSTFCELKELFFCGNNAICQQINQSSEIGVCKCLKGFHYDEQQNECLNASSKIDEPTKEKLKQPNYIIVIATVVPIVILLICASFAFISVRFRWWQRVRSRFQVRVYDQMLIGGPQDAEDDDPVV